MKTIKKTALATCAITLAIGWALPAAAQDAAQVKDDNSVLNGEIIVTAQKRQENVQNVGIAITAYSGKQLRALGIEKSSDIASYSPGVHISGSLAGQNFRNVRRACRLLALFGHAAMPALSPLCGRNRTSTKMASEFQNVRPVDILASCSTLVESRPSSSIVAAWHGSRPAVQV